MTDPNLPSISVNDLSYKISCGENLYILDVRQPEENAENSIPGSILIPLAELRERLEEIPREREILVHCKAGGRSARAVRLLHEEGFSNVINVDGGMDAWLSLQG